MNPYDRMPAARPPIHTQPAPYPGLSAAPSYTRWGLGVYPSGSLPFGAPPSRLRSQEWLRDSAVHLYQQQPLTFVLVHGSWADASFWDGTAASLRRMGHTVHVPEYPGHGADPNRNVTHSMISTAVADYIVAHNLRDIVLAGHSFGGTVIQKAAELVPDRVKRIVFQNAFVLLDGQSLADAFPPEALELFKQLRESSGDNTIMLPFPFFRDVFVNLADLETAKRIYAGVKPEPAGPLFEKLDLKKFYSLTIPKSYVNLLEDNVLPQTDEYSWHPHLSGRLGVFRLIQGHGDHMTTARIHPGVLAKLLVEAGRD